MKYLARAEKTNKKFDLAFVDRPSFYEDKVARVDFDINRDHLGSDLFFSINHQRFEPRFEELTVKEIIALTPRTIPEDYRNLDIYHCGQIKV